MSKQYCVYILTNRSHRVLYIGMTNNLVRRINEHKNHLIKGFTDKYNVTKLVFYEVAPTANSAILREKQQKKWSRSKKEWLIEQNNPNWLDLVDEVMGYE